MISKYSQKTILLIVLLFLSNGTKSQVSQIDRMDFEQDYHADSSLIFNYTPKHNILVSYGYFENTPSIHGLHRKSSFFLEDIGSGNSVHLVTLPVGYKVNDVCFVSLKRDSSDLYDDYCCFCGIHIKYLDTYAFFDTTLRDSYFYIYDTTGFVGYFKMNDAYSPSTSKVATIRDVEGAKELNRMIGYEERYGSYHANQTTYADNAVLDIVGVPVDSLHALSCMCRVKFYPEYPIFYGYGSINGTRWDNNIRYDNHGIEIMENIAEGIDQFVTVSRFKDNDTTVWIRFNQKETSLVSGGLELNHTILYLKLSQLNISDNYLENRFLTYFKSPIQLCFNRDNNYSMAFRLLNDREPFDGVTTIRFDNNESNIKWDASIDVGHCGVNDLIYYYYLDGTSTILQEDGNRAQIASFTYWNESSYNYYPTIHLTTSNYVLQSSSWHFDNNDIICWTGIHNQDSKPIYLLKQSILPSEETTLSCSSISNHESLKATIEKNIDSKAFDIKIRYPDLQDVFTIERIHFNPYTVKRKKLCTQ